MNNKILLFSLDLDNNIFLNLDWIMRLILILLMLFLILNNIFYFIKIGFLNWYYLIKKMLWKK